MGYVMTPTNPTPPDMSNLNRLAFLDALEEIADMDVREELYNMIESVKRLFMAKSNLKETAANNQAVEFVAACVWKKAKGNK